MNFFLDEPRLVAAFDRGVAWDRVVPLAEGPDADVADNANRRAPLIRPPRSP